MNKTNEGLSCNQYLDGSNKKHQGVRNYTGMSFWVRGCFVSKVGGDKKVIREYIQNQEKADLLADQFQSQLI
jgi:hypothetical protein